jgi:hypothetical protein
MAMMDFSSRLLAASLKMSDPAPYLEGANRLMDEGLKLWATWVDTVRHCSQPDAWLHLGTQATLCCQDLQAQWLQQVAENAPADRMVRHDELVALQARLDMAAKEIKTHKGEIKKLKQQRSRDKAALAARAQAVAEQKKEIADKDQAIQALEQDISAREAQMARLQTSPAAARAARPKSGKP